MGLFSVKVQCERGFNLRSVFTIVSVPLKLTEINFFVPDRKTNSSSRFDDAPDVVGVNQRRVERPPRRRKRYDASLDDVTGKRPTTFPKI